MQFSVLALAAFVASAVAQSNQTVVAHTTVTLTAYTYVCPEATTLTHGTKTYTGAAHETLTLTEGPYTVVKPIYTSSVVVCKECPPPSTGTASAGFPVYTNGTKPTYYPPGVAQPTLEIVPTFAPHVPTATPSIIEANSGNRVFAFSGASLAALVAVAAFIL